MKLYYCEGHYYALKRDAEKHAREAARDSFHDVVVTIAHVATDKTNVLRMLNTGGGHTSFGEEVYTAKGKRSQ